MPIIDFRVRPPIEELLTAKMFAENDRTAAFSQNAGFTPAPSLLGRSLELLEKELDEAQVDVAVFPTRTGAGGFGDIHWTASANFAHGNSRYRVFAAPDMSKSTEGVLEDLDAALSDPSVVGIGIEPGVMAPPRYIDDLNLWPIYAFCQSRDVPVILMGGGSTGPDLSYTDPIRLDRMLAAFPHLRVLLSHGGWPWVTQVLHIAFRRPNLFVSPDMYLFGFPGMDDYIRAANGYLKDRFVYASSYPFIPVGAHRRYTELGFNDDVLERVLYKNAARLLELE